MNDFAEMCGTYIAIEMKKDKEKKQKNCKHKFVNRSYSTGIDKFVILWICENCNFEITGDDIEIILNSFVNIKEWERDKAWWEKDA